MDLDEIIDSRHSVRSFKSKKPDWRKIVEALDAARKSPLAGNIPTLKFLIIDDEKKIKRIAKASQQDFIEKTDYVVVVCSDPEQLERSYDERGRIYQRQQAGAAIENFLLKLTEQGLSTCWVGAFNNTEIKKILNIPDNIKVEALFPIGYEMGEHSQPRKPELDESLFFNKWGQKQMNPENVPGD